ncbi:hypothetical protein M885DRAFT_573957, partial [Pelagophyceae sp. CCMP2097]
MASAVQPLAETTEKAHGFARTELRGSFEQYDGKYYVHLTLICDERGRPCRRVKLQRGLYHDVQTALLGINAPSPARAADAPSADADAPARDADAPVPDADAPSADTDAPLARGRSWKPRQGAVPLGRAPALRRNSSSSLARDRAAAASAEDATELAEREAASKRQISRAHWGKSRSKSRRSIKAFSRNRSDKRKRQGHSAPKERDEAAAAGLSREGASQVWRDVALDRIQERIVGDRTHELLKGWSADEEVCSPYTEGQILKVSRQANLVYILVRTVAQRHFNVCDGDLDLEGCAAAALAASPYRDAYKATTVLRWYRDYRANDGFFTPDARGSYKRCTLTTWVVENEDVLLEFKAWIKAGLSGLNVAKATAYLASDVVPKIPAEDKIKYKISDDVPSRAAVYGLMTHKSVGCLFRTRTKCFYVDAHECEDVRVDRAHYCTLFFEFELRMYKWIQITLDDAATLRGKYPNMPPGHAYTAPGGVAMVEFHEYLHEANGARHFRSPGLATLNVGKARDGYWDGDNFLLQTEDVLDVLEAWLPGIEFLTEIDHSSGHDKFKPDGLNVYRMNANFGGQQAFIRTSEKLTA